LLIQSRDIFKKRVRRTNECLENVS
jgi:hypothetical protein